MIFWIKKLFKNKENLTNLIYYFNKKYLLFLNKIKEIHVNVEILNVLNYIVNALIQAKFIRKNASVKGVKLIVLEMKEKKF